MGMLECCCYVIRQPMTLLLSYGLFTVNLFMLSVNAFIAQCVLLCVLLGRDTGRKLLALIDSKVTKELRRGDIYCLYFCSTEPWIGNWDLLIKTRYAVCAIFVSTYFQTRNQAIIQRLLSFERKILQNCVKNGRYTLLSALASSWFSSF